jgi:hypothetical protein
MLNVDLYTIPTTTLTPTNTILLLPTPVSLGIPLTAIFALASVPVGVTIAYVASAPNISN